MDDHYYGDKIIARFEPKNRDTLRACMLPLIGRTFEWEFVGTGSEDEPYPGQTRWMITRKHDDTIADEAKGRWAPFEDLVVIDGQSKSEGT